MAREDLHFRLRIPEDLKVRIASLAEANKRSMTAEILARLEESLDPPEAPMPAKAAALVEDIMQRVVSRVEKIAAMSEARVAAVEKENSALKAQLAKPEEEV